VPLITMREPEKCMLRLKGVLIDFGGTLAHFDEDDVKEAGEL